MRNNNILVNSLAQGRVVEHLVSNITRRPASEMGDLVQMVYEILLRKSPRQLRRVMRNRAMNYYIIGIIRNQYFSNTSPYHRKIRRHDRHADVPQEQ